ncbi:MULTISPECIES: hypothetical protein [Rhizobium]|uniref:hypothetical protein n=1 Tax=Rhizobium TaxID=379 RepID=UPI0015E18A36|nr:MULTISPECIES: hypothetical protein [Rhizobium]KAF5883993.1 hypothetical protein FY112_17940 [Rhizobium sp. PEPV16]
MVISLFYTQLDVSYQEEGSKSSKAARGKNDDAAKLLERHQHHGCRQEERRSRHETSKESGLIKSPSWRAVPSMWNDYEQHSHERALRHDAVSRGLVSAPLESLPPSNDKPKAAICARAVKQKGRSTLAGSALILSDNEQFDDVDTARIHFSGRTGIWTLSAGVSRGRFAVPHDNRP